MLDPIPLEDDACDVIAKAMHGHEMTPQTLAARAGINEDAVHSAIKGNQDKETLEKIAIALELSPTALVRLKSYRPTTKLPDGLLRFVSPFGHAGVNAYVLVTGHTALIFDTGTDTTSISRFLTGNNLDVDTLYITHRHHDHISGVSSFSKSCIVYPEQSQHGDSVELANGQQLKTLDVSGHFNPARAYLYEGLEVPVCIVGDSIFAGSMGKTSNKSNYKLALETARNNLLTLPSSTILCSGHGPLTTVRNELKNNPFLNIV